MLLLAKDFSCFEFTAMTMSTPSNSSFIYLVFKPKYSKTVSAQSNQHTSAEIQYPGGSTVSSSLPLELGRLV